MAVTVRTAYALNLTAEPEPPPTTIGAAAFSAQNQRYTRSSFGLDGTTDVTICLWAKMAVNRTTYSFCVSVDDGGGNYVQLGPGGTGINLGVSATTGGITPNTGAGQNMSLDTWTFMATVWRTTGGGTDDNHAYAIAPSTDVSMDAATYAGFNSASGLWVGGDGFGDWFNGSIAQVKIWTAALSEAELEAELPVDGVVRSSNLHAYYSFRDGPQTTDESGNSRTLTAGAGSAALDEDGPPVS